MNDNEARAMGRRLPVILVCVFLFLILMFMYGSTRAAGGLVVRDPSGNSVSLHTGQCSTSPWLKEWKAATMVYQGKRYDACWRLQGSTVVILDSGGDITPVPAQAFKEEIGV